MREAAFPPAASSSLSDFTDSGSHRELKGKARAKAREDKGRERDRIETQRALEKAVQAGSVGTSPLAMRCTTLNREGECARAGSSPANPDRQNHHHLPTTFHQARAVHSIWPAAA